MWEGHVPSSSELSIILMAFYNNIFDWLMISNKHLNSQWLKLMKQDKSPPWADSSELGVMLG